MNLKELVMYSKGKLNTPFDENTKIEAFTIDGREKIENSFFIPLSSKKEERTTHIMQAFENGAIGAFSEEKIDVPEGKFYIQVEDNLKALHELAKNFRMSISNIPLIAITGSVGKTTTKDMVYAVLSAKYRTLKNTGNLNNEIGMPYTLVNYQNEQMIVLEMGMSAFGEISLLTNIAKPDVAVITNIGTSHIGILGSRENILKAKLEILEGMNDKGVLVVNQDNDLLRTVGKVTPKKYTIGIRNQADLMAYHVQVGSDGTSFCVKDHDKEYCFTIKLSSEKFVENALLAIAVGKLYEVPMDKIKVALENCEYTKMRSHTRSLNGITLIEDYYNASLESIRAALDTMKANPGTRKVAILGDVLELGEYASSLHEAIGEEVSLAGVDKLIVIGENRESVKKGAIQKSMNPENIETFAKTEDVLEHLKTLLQKGDVVLIKASRGMHFEKIIEKLESMSL